MTKLAQLKLNHNRLSYIPSCLGYLAHCLEIFYILPNPLSMPYLDLLRSAYLEGSFGEPPDSSTFFEKMINDTSEPTRLSLSINENDLGNDPGVFTNTSRDTPSSAPISSLSQPDLAFIEPHSNSLNRETSQSKLMGELEFDRLILNEKKTLRISNSFQLASEKLEKNVRPTKSLEFEQLLAKTETIKISLSRRESDFSESNVSLTSENTDKLSRTGSITSSMLISEVGGKFTPRLSSLGRKEKKELESVMDQDKSMALHEEYLYDLPLLRLLGHLRDEFDLLQTAQLYQTQPLSHLKNMELTPSKRYIYQPLRLTVNSISPQALNVLNELVKTEETYVNELQTLFDLYIKPLVSRGTNKELVQTLFSNYEDILVLHRDYFLHDLGQLKSYADFSIGKVLISLGNCMSAYSQCINNFDVTIALLDHLRLMSTTSAKKVYPFVFPTASKPSLFGSITLNIDKAEAIALMELISKATQSTRHAQIDINSYLLLPTQRLARYRLLIAALLEATEKIHPDYPYIHQALHIFDNKVEYCNEKKREWLQEMDALQSLCHIRIHRSTINLDYLVHSPLERSFIRSSKPNHFKLVKYVELRPLLDPNLLSRKKMFHRSLGATSEYRFQSTGKAAPHYLSKTSTYQNAAALFDVQGIIGISTHLYLFNDMLLLCSLQKESDTVVRVVSLGNQPFKSYHAEVRRVPSPQEDEAVARITDGFCVIYILGKVQDITEWCDMVNQL